MGLLFLIACTSEQKQSVYTLLAAADFAEKIIELPAAPIIDVRTDSEFAKAHLENAVNLDINSDQFQDQISKLDQSKPVFVYCLSGGRSAAAVNQMRSMGFKEVYELEGGLMKWRAANLPIVTNSFPGAEASPSGMTQEEFQKIITSDKLVLVDFYADWCAPCRKMKPYLEQIAADMKDRVVVVRINADDHPQLCKDLDVTGLPTLQLYKNNNLTWVNSGYLDKGDVVKQLK